MDPCTVSSIIGQLSFGNDIQELLQTYLKSRFKQYYGNEIELSKNKDGFFCISYCKQPVISGHAAYDGKNVVENIFRFLTMDVECFYQQCVVYYEMHEKSNLLLMKMRKLTNLPLHFSCAVELVMFSKTPNQFPIFNCHIEWKHNDMVFFADASNSFYGWFAQTEAISKMANIMFEHLGIAKLQKKM